MSQNSETSCIIMHIGYHLFDQFFRWHWGCHLKMENMQHFNLIFPSIDEWETTLVNVGVPGSMAGKFEYDTNMYLHALATVVSVRIPIVEYAGSFGAFDDNYCYMCVSMLFWSGVAALSLARNHSWTMGEVHTRLVLFQGASSLSSLVAGVCW